jgi:hypothetical protein
MLLKNEIFFLIICIKTLIALTDSSRINTTTPTPVIDGLRNFIQY